MSGRSDEPRGLLVGIASHEDGASGTARLEVTAAATTPEVAAPEVHAAAEVT